MGQHVLMKTIPLPTSRPLAWFGLALLTLTSLACAVEPPTAVPVLPSVLPPVVTPIATPTGSASLLPPIKALIGDAGCDSDAQCHSIGVGAKACGGPDGYLAWSTRNTDAVALRALTERQAQVQRDEQASSGMLSNCQFMPDPGARCVAAGGQRKCQLNTGAVGAS